MPMLRSIALCVAALVVGACSTEPDAGPDPAATSIVAARGVADRLADDRFTDGCTAARLRPVAVVPIACPDEFDDEDRDECYTVEVAGRSG